MAIRVMTLTDMKKTRMRSRLLRLLPHLPNKACLPAIGLYVLLVVVGALFCLNISDQYFLSRVANNKQLFVMS